MLDLIWVAKFKDGSIIKQYDDPLEQKIENTFKGVLDRQDELEKFALINVHSNELYVVNLRNGTLSITRSGETELEPDDDMLREDAHGYRLIYFRRVSRTFGFDFKELDSPNIVYFLGFQYNDKDGRNQKRLIKIDNSGKVLVN